MSFLSRWNTALISMHTSYTDAPHLLSEPFLSDSTSGAQLSLFYLEFLENTFRNFPFTLEMQNLNSYLLLYIKKGKVKLTLDNQLFHLTPNAFLFLNCMTYHKIELISQELEFEIMYLNGPQISYYHSIFIQNETPFCQCSPNSEIITTLHKLYCYQGESTTTVELIRSSLITSLLTSLVLSKNTDYSQTTFIPFHVKQMIAILHNRYAEKHTLESLANELNFNKYKLAKDFKKYVHTSPIDYLINRRIEIAKQLLTETNKTINEISELVGFLNTPHFIQIFKKNTGITPLQYRINPISIR